MSIELFDQPVLSLSSFKAADGVSETPCRLRVEEFSHEWVKVNIDFSNHDVQLF